MDKVYLYWQNIVNEDLIFIIWLIWLFSHNKLYFTNVDDNQVRISKDIVFYALTGNKSHRYLCLWYRLSHGQTNRYIDGSWTVTSNFMNAFAYHEKLKKVMLWCWWYNDIKKIKKRKSKGWSLLPSRLTFYLRNIFFVYFVTLMLSHTVGCTYF